MASKSRKSTVAAIKRHRAARMAHVSGRAYYLHRKKQDDELYNLICNEMVSLGGVYIKFLQGVLLQSTMMKRWQDPNKLRIFENVEAEPLDVYEFLKAELKPEALAKIAEVQPQPFAAGSFGQVYNARLQDGTQVIVKILRPMIRETLKFDIKLLSGFSKAFSKKLHPNTQMDLSGPFKEFAQSTLKETDYVAEANFAAEQYETYKNHDKLVIPQTYLDLCSDNVIVQEYIGGVSAAYLVGLKEQGVDPSEWVRDELGSDLETQMKTLSFELLWGIFELPRIMGDPHPGNVKLLADNKVALIDFGISARPSENQAAYFGLLEEYSAMADGDFDMIRLFTKTLRFFGGDLYRALLTLGGIAKEDLDLNEELSKVVDQNINILTGGQKLEDILASPKALTFINQAANKNNKFGFIMKIESTEMLRAAHSVTTMLESLGLYNQVIEPVYKDLIAKVKAEKPELITKQDDGMPAARALDIVSAWLERVAERDPLLFQSLMSKLKLKSVAKKASE